VFVRSVNIWWFVLHALLLGYTDASTDHTKHFWSLFLTLTVQCLSAIRFGVGMYGEPWRGRNLVIQITKFVTRSMIKPLPREFQCSTWSDSSRAMLSMYTSWTSLISCRLVPKYGGTCMMSPFSRSRRNMASARVCTRIDLQQQHKKKVSVH